MALRSPLVALVSVVACVALALGACDRGPGAGTSIKVVIADYSKDHTKPFWQSLAGDYTKRTGVKVDLQAVSYTHLTLPTTERV